MIFTNFDKNFTGCSRRHVSQSYSYIDCQCPLINTGQSSNMEQRVSFTTTARGYDASYLNRYDRHMDTPYDGNYEPMICRGIISLYERLLGDLNLCYTIILRFMGKHGDWYRNRAFQGILDGVWWYAVNCELRHTQSTTHSISSTHCTCPSATSVTVPLNQAINCIKRSTDCCLEH